jgi:hypothetical protein
MLNLNISNGIAIELIKINKETNTCVCPLFFPNLLTEGPSAPGDLLQESPGSDLRRQDLQGPIGQDIAQGAKETASAAASSGVIKKKKNPCIVLLIL